MKVVGSLMFLLPCVFAFAQVRVSQPILMTMIDQNEPMDKVFSSYVEFHGKKYESEVEETMRQRIFEVNVNYIKEHNLRYAKGEKSYYLGLNQFTDMTHREFLSLYTGHLHKRNPNRNASSFIEPANLACPSTVDWREKGYVTDVKNQGQCGSCWAFSTTGSLEGQHFAKTGKLVSLSEQQLVDCSEKFGNQGCNGGLMDQAFEYIKSIKGLEGESDYVYEAERETCHYNAALEKAEVTGYVDVESGSESKLKKAVCAKGPISIAIDASHPSFQSYEGGVYDEEECSSEQLDHGVLVVGYGTDSDTDYWLVKNSWGTSWGLDGYVKMIRNKDNQCGVATQASYPLV